MMATAAVIGLSTGKRLLNSSFCPSDLAEKLFPVTDGSLQSFSSSAKSIIIAQKSSHFGSNASTSRDPKQSQALKALKEDVSTLVPSTTDGWFAKPGLLKNDDSDFESSLEVLVLLQKSMLEKQFELPSTQMTAIAAPGETSMHGITCSGISARQRRTSTRRRCSSQKTSMATRNTRQFHPIVSPDLLNMKLSGYIRGNFCENLLSHAEVVNLSKKIKIGLSLEEHRSKLKEKLGSEPSEKQLASSLSISHAELRSKLMECSLAREKLTMSNVRLVMSIAQKYENLGADMADLIQGGLIGLLRGIEKFDSSKGFRISTYVYWWIRQGVSRALVQNSRTLRLPTHLHERLTSIRNAKIRLEENGITPSIDKLAASLKMSQKKVMNATEAVSIVISLDREAFPSLNGIPGDTLHSYVADRKLENNPWHGFEDWSLKDEVNKLLLKTLSKREIDIIRLYHGLGNECHTWEDISRQFGLSRERVRQVGLVAMEKLKHAARKKGLEAMFIK